jgi:hypothetical protein
VTTVTLTVGGERVSLAVDRLINAGYSGRDEAAVREHVDELLADDAIAEAPDRVPATYRLDPGTIRVDPDAVTVVGERTSGEAEFALLCTDRATYVTAASDHTDRSIERHGIQRAKQIAPDALSAGAWRLADVPAWDRLRLRAWTVVDGERRRYQDATLGELLAPDDLRATVRERHGGPLAGTAVCSGTVPTVDGELRHGERFAVELADPVRGRRLSLDYRVDAV